MIDTSNSKPSEQLLAEALRYEEQAKHESDPRIIRHLRRMAQLSIEDAAEEEQKELTK